MKAWSLNGFRYLTLLLLMSLAPTCYAESVDLQLLGRSLVNDYQVNLSERDWQWLSRKGVLVLGTSSPDYAPFDISAGSDYFEGLTADYAGLLSQLLHIDVKVRRYASRAEVIAALRRGEVDLLGSANAFEKADHQLIFSSPYAVDTPMLVTRIGDNSLGDIGLKGRRLAMLYHYQPPEVVRALYPGIDLKLYSSTLGAIGAVAFGQADVYLGDSISTSYLINKNYLNNVRINDFSTLDEQTFTFALDLGSRQLQRIVNTALAVIPSDERYTILSRWGSIGIGFDGGKQLSFSASEQRWIETHPRLKVATGKEDFLPFTFFDDRNVFSGMSVDLLKKISLRTGLKFDVVQRSSTTEVIDAVKNGDADLLIAFTASSAREKHLRFTKPYFSTPYVLITRDSFDAPGTLDEFSGRRVSVFSGGSVIPYLTEHFPDVQLVNADSSMKALLMVENGSVDGAIITLVSGSYMINQHYTGVLSMRSTVGAAPTQFSMAIDRNASELYSILNKALASISPEEMNDLTSRWRSAVILDNRYWVRNRDAIIKISAIGLGVLVIGVGWIVYLRWLIRRRAQAERALNDQLEFMRALMDGTPHPIYVRDREGRLLVCNEGYLEVFGIDREAVIGKTLLELKFNPSEQNRAYHADYLIVMQEGRSLVRDHQLQLPTGQTLTIYHWILPYRGSDGVVVGMIGGWIDISDRQHLLEQLKDAKNTADKANQAKSDFLTTMSHEIRTPMNAVIGMLELALKKAEVGIADSAAIGVASGAARGLLGLIGDILDIAHIESGQVLLNQRRTNLMKLVESTARVFEAMAQQKGLQMILELDQQIDVDVLVDPIRFRQVLSNLLSNAIKFTYAGYVRLSVRANNSEECENFYVCIEVQDTGVGISSEDQQRLFAPFTQATNQTQLAGTSSGLGLIISRRLCEMMGGSLSLESTLGEGTRISMELCMLKLLPLEPAEDLSPELPDLTRKLKILVVDDYPANRILLTQQLKYLGHSVVDAEDGAKALEVWRRQRFDMIITDCSMPVMNGYELARAIRIEEGVSDLSPVMIVGFTANAQTGEVERCLEAGMNDCMFKPISLENLKARLSSANIGPISFAVDDEILSTDKIIDLTSIEQLTDGDDVALKKLLDTLVVSIDDDLSSLIKAFAKDDLLGMGDLAHKVKNGSRIIRAKHLTQCCENVEEACEGTDAGLLAQRVDELHAAMTQVLEAIEDYRE
ncbi:transporter substrate-binding domain-containing protein [Pseudomonas reactans]